MKNYCVDCGKETKGYRKRCCSCSAKGNKNTLGKHWSLSEEIKKKMSRSHKGKYPSKKTKEKMSKNSSHYWLGKSFLKEHKEKISKAKTGCIGYWLGKPRSKETKQKIREKVLQHIQIHPGPYKDTKPELKMKEILNDLNISFKHQFRVEDCSFDFHILNTNILIEVDGDYYHSNPKMFTKLNKMQLEMKERDKKHNEVAKTNNFILLRFWGSDILRNENKIVEKLGKYYETQFRRK